jgi:hypothetical protein
MGQHYTPKKTVPLTLADHQPKERTCLGCGKKFWSLGPANRHCAPCKRKLDGLHETTVYDTGFKR